VPDIAAINTVGRVILLVEAAAVMEPYLGDRSKFGPDVLALLDQGRLIPATDYIQAQRLRRLAQQEFRALWDTVDCLVTPTTPAPAPRIGATTTEFGGVAEDVRLAATRLVRAINVLGLPALSMPCGLSSERLPLGLQVVGPPFRERRILALGAAIEDALPSRPEPPASV
jgi:aspartyl-tRNA(Asn)/glutamyl-tRNA(Gln) amidotransferase subunit A